MNKGFHKFWFSSYHFFLNFGGSGEFLKHHSSQVGTIMFSGGVSCHEIVLFKYKTDFLPSPFFKMNKKPAFAKSYCFFQILVVYWVSGRILDLTRKKLDLEAKKSAFFYKIQIRWNTREKVFCTLSIVLLCWPWISKIDLTSSVPLSIPTDPTPSPAKKIIKVFFQKIYHWKVLVHHLARVRVGLWGKIGQKSVLTIWK